MSGLILIIEDEPDLVSTLQYNLEREGFTTRAALDGKTGLEAALLEPLPDLVLLDLMLPDIGGTEVCRGLRNDARTQGIPVIMVTAKGAEIDRVVGFEVGADDYVVKPFSVRELLLRIRAVLRRTHGDSAEPDIIEFGEIAVDVPAHRVRIDGVEVPLTVLEFKLLTTLLNRRGRVQSREQLLSDVWEYNADVNSRTVDTHVKRLREKLAVAGRYVQTVRGIGYRFAAEPDRGTA